MAERKKVAVVIHNREDIRNELDEIFRAASEDWSTRPRSDVAPDCGKVDRTQSICPNACSKSKILNENDSNSSLVILHISNPCWLSYLKALDMQGLSIPTLLVTGGPKGAAEPQAYAHCVGFPRSFEPRAFPIGCWKAFLAEIGEGILSADKLRRAVLRHFFTGEILSKALHDLYLRLLPARICLETHHQECSCWKDTLGTQSKSTLLKEAVDFSGFTGQLFTQEVADNYSLADLIENSDRLKAVPRPLVGGTSANDFLEFIDANLSLEPTTTIRGKQFLDAAEALENYLRALREACRK